MKNVNSVSLTDVEAVKQKVKDVKKRKWLPYVITTVTLAVLTLLVAWARGAFSAVDPKTLSQYHVTVSKYRFVQWSDSFSLVGLVCLFLGISVFIKYGSIIGLIVSAVKRIIALFREDRIDRKYGKYYDRQVEDKPRPYAYLVLVGAAYLLVGILFIFIYNKM